AWIEAVRRGRTFVTSGPLLLLTVNGQPPGSVVKLPGPNQVVHVRAEVIFSDASAELTLWKNGESAGVADLKSAPCMEMDIAFEASGWVEARCQGRGGTRSAFTSPVYVEVEGHDHQASASDQLAALIGNLFYRRNWIQ